MNQPDRKLWATLRRDCRHFRSDRPCAPHKARGVVCASCDVYERAHPKITLVKLAATGDVLRTTAFLPAIRRKYPHAQLRWLTLAHPGPLFEGNRLVDEVTICDGEHLPARLLTEAQDIVLCPDADATTAALAARIPLREGGRRIGFGLDDDGLVEPLNDAALRWYLLGVSDSEKRANRETYQNLVGALLELPTPIVDRPVLELSSAEEAAAAAWFEGAKSEHPDVQTWIGLVTGAGSRWPRKQWTSEHQVEFIKRQVEGGRGVVLLGGPHERERHDAIRSALEGAAVLDAGNDNPLRDFAARLACVDAVVTGDTLAMHMATAFSKPVVALFGPTSSHEIELYGSGEKVYAAELDCLCCYSRCERTPSCMDLIRVESVEAALEGLLAASS